MVFYALMPGSERTLYQFPVSHYCEKSRWNLDAKGLSYEIKNLLPGLHRRVTTRLTKGRGTVPVLVENGAAIGDSTEIALHLERAHPSSPALVPASEPERKRVLELEDYFDYMAGAHVRRWMYAQLIDGGADLGALVFSGYPAPQRWIGRMMSPVLASLLRRQYKLVPPKVEESRVKLLEGLERLEREIQGDPSRYLVGFSLSIADITAAALYSPLLAPEGSPYAARPGEVVPPAIAELRAAVLARPAGQWLLRRYREDRQRPARGFNAASQAANG